MLRDQIRVARPQRQILEEMSLKAPVADSDWTVYILRCADDSLYTGITNNVSRRVAEHNASARGASYTRGRRPVALAFSHKVEDRAAASRLEAWIKAQTRKTKESIITHKISLPTGQQGGQI